MEKHTIEIGEVMDNIKKFLNGVKKELKRVRWPKRNEMIKFSVATISFIVFFAFFFAMSDLLIVFLKGLRG